MLEPISVPAGAALEHLVPADAPARPRAVAVLDGVLSGRAWVDDPADPRAVLVIEDADGTVFAGGSLTRDDVRTALAGFATRSGDLVFGFASDDDPLRDLVPAEPLLARAGGRLRTERPYDVVACRAALPDSQRA